LDEAWGSADEEASMQGLTIEPVSEIRRSAGNATHTATFKVALVPKPFDRPLPVGTSFHVSEGGYRTVAPGVVYATDADIEDGDVTIIYEVEQITA
jgi:hypothetical protein